MTPTIPPERAGTLEQEVRTWLAHKDRLLHEARGQFVVIQGDHILGTFQSEKEAFTQAHRHLGLGRFLVREIMPGEKVYYVSGSALEPMQKEGGVASPDNP